MSEELQVFKSSALQWIYHHNAYNKDEVKQIPNRYTNFSDAIIDCNNAISNSGLNGMSVHGVGPVQLDYIYAKPYDKDITAIRTKITNLNTFTSLIHEECRQKIDKPFCDSLKNLFTSVYNHSNFVVSGGLSLGELNIGEVKEEEIRQWLETCMGNYDEESQYLTSDPKVNDYIRYYNQRQPGPNGKFNYEYALMHYDSLNYYQRQALYHIYEYNLRMCEADLEGTSASYKTSKAVVDRMTPYLFTYSEMNTIQPTSACKGMWLRTGKDSHCAYILQDILQYDQVDGEQLTVFLDEEKTMWIHATPDAFSVSIEPYKGGMRVELTYSFTDPELAGASGTKELSYFCSETRSYAYIKSEEKKHPGCFDHQKSLGFTDIALAELFSRARSSNDADILDNMIKGSGQSYDQIFNIDPSKMTVSGASAIALYNGALSQQYYLCGDEACRQEAARMNSFLMKGESQYSQQYYNLFIAGMNYLDEDYKEPAKTNVFVAVARGMESEISVWPTAIYTLKVNSDLKDVEYIDYSELKKITPITAYGDEDVDIINKIGFGSPEDFSMQERLSFYKAMADNDRSLDSAQLKDLRNIYYSYLDYIQYQQINLYATDEERKCFDQLCYIMNSLDSHYSGMEFWKDQNAKMAKAAEDCPNAYTVGKFMGDLVIYAVWNTATGGLGSAAGVEIESFVGRMAAATVADIVIKDLPRAVMSYANGEDIGKVALEFTEEVFIDAAANAVGEAVGDAFGGARTREKLVDDFANAADPVKYLNKLSPSEVGLLVSRMDIETGAKVLSQVSDEVAQKALKEMPEYTAIKMAGELYKGVDISDTVKAIESIGPNRAMDIFESLSQETKISVLGELDRSTSDALSKAYYGKVTDYPKFSEATRIIANRTDIGDYQKFLEMKELYYNAPYKADVNIPKEFQYIKGFTATGNVDYYWPEYYGFKEGTMRAISRNDGIPEYWDRYGFSGGKNFSDLPDAGKYTYDQRAIPYIENEAAYHCGFANNKSYFDKIDAIKKRDLDALNGILKKEGLPELNDKQFFDICKNYQNGITDIKTNIKEYSSSIDVTYGIKGNADEWMNLSGGAGQLVTPLSVGDLKTIGVLKETTAAEVNAMKTAQDLAENLYKRASDIEPATTNVMKSLESADVKLVGLEHRLKTLESLQRKILNDSQILGKNMEDAALDISDSLRYTFVSSEDDYIKMVNNTLEELQRNGCIVEQLKNYWGDDVYQGINTVIKTADGTKIEVQFHTDNSFYTKEVLNHPYYEIARSQFASIDEIEEATMIMIDNQSKVIVPNMAKDCSLETIKRYYYSSISTYEEWQDAITLIGRRNDLSSFEKVEELRQLYNFASYKVNDSSALYIKMDKYVSDISSSGEILLDWKKIIDDPPKEILTDEEIKTISVMALKKGEKAGLTKQQIDNLRRILNGEKPPVEAYLSEMYIYNHLRQFEETGCYKIISDKRGVPSGTIGAGQDDLYVLNGKDVAKIIEKANGNPRILEKELAMPNGYLGDQPYIIRADRYNNLRMSTGNEANGWQDEWCPGGTTRNGCDEAVIDPLPVDDYSYKKCFGESEWTKGGK
nr:hypothetical protein [uncultured Butyrivibrio sp.]